MENHLTGGSIVNTYWRHFKLPLIVTALTLTVMTVVGILIIPRNQPGNPPAADGAANQQAAAFGQSLGLVATLIVGPFWVYGVLEAGKERRAELRASRAKPNPSRRKNKR